MTMTEPHPPEFVTLPGVSEGLVVRPGDTVMVRLDYGHADYAELDLMQAQLSGLLPDNRIVMLVADGVARVTSQPTDVDTRVARLRALANERAADWDEARIKPAEVLAILDGPA